MSENFKVSASRFPLPPAQGWSFETRPGGWIIATSPEGLRKRLMLHERQGKLGFSLGGRLYFGSVQKDARTSQPGEAAGADSDLVAQFPGKVRKILVTIGASVKVGEPLILLEAMKMEFTVKSPFSGVIERVLVQEGQQLTPGDRFFDIQPKAPSHG